MNTRDLPAWQERHGAASLLEAVEQAVQQGRRGLWCPGCWEQFQRLIGVESFGAGAYGLCPRCLEETHSSPDGWVWTPRRIED